MLLLGSLGLAAEDLAQSFTYQGKLMNAAGTAPLSGPVDIRVQIIGKMGAEECVLYDETQLAI
jgi:hypothetical protein